MESWETCAAQYQCPLHSDDLINRDVREPIDLPTGPGNLKRFEFGVLAEPKMNARIKTRRKALTSALNKLNPTNKEPPT